MCYSAIVDTKKAEHMHAYVAAILVPIHQGHGEIHGPDPMKEGRTMLRYYQGPTPMRGEEGAAFFSF